MRWFALLGLIGNLGCGMNGIETAEVWPAELELRLFPEGVRIAGGLDGAASAEGGWVAPADLADLLAAAQASHVLIRIDEQPALVLFARDLTRVMESTREAGLDGFSVVLAGTRCGDFTSWREGAQGVRLEASDLRFGEDFQGDVRRLPLTSLAAEGGGRQVVLELDGSTPLESVCAALSCADGDMLQVAAHSGPY